MFNLFNVLIVAVLVKHSYGLCIPCPNEEINFSSFDCTCDLGTFYDNTTKQCVKYADCPAINYKFNPLSGFNNLAPVLFDVFSNSVKKSQPDYATFFKAPKDFTLIAEAVLNRSEIIRKQLPSLLSPIIAPVVMKNKNILGECKGKALCIVMEAMKKPENYNIILPKLKPILTKVVDEFSYVFDDLEEISKDCGYSLSGCPLIKAIVDLRSFIPGTLESLQDFSTVGFEMMKYTFGDVDTYLQPYVKKLA